ncbi:hypothetical protein ACRALDRAFT_213733 [Sodiomyces alcalophilus JCM 7366]|uniref:uncharacterized protein n=1 Tax=Sodiomyces alcalophilus JCM 7366 TaxID=591952 RepID=UPI0039B396C0
MADNRGSELEGVTILFLVTSMVAVSLRSYVRAAILRSFSADDWFAVATLAIDYGSGRRLSSVSLENVSGVLKATYNDHVHNPAQFTWLTIAYSVELGAVAKDTDMARPRHYPRLNIFYLFIVIFHCSPPEYYWLRILGTDNGTCLPDPFISNTAYLNLKTRDKLLLAFVLALGSINHPIWSSVENGLALTAMSLVTLRPLIRKFLLHYRGSGNEADAAQNGAIHLSRSENTQCECVRHERGQIGPVGVREYKEGKPYTDLREMSCISKAPTRDQKEARAHIFPSAASKNITRRNGDAPARIAQRRLLRYVLIATLAFFLLDSLLIRPILPSALTISHRQANVRDN